FYQAWPADIDASYFGLGYSSVSGGVYIFDAAHLPVQYVETAARNGIITGYSDKTFRPQNKLTRQEAAVILARVANLRLMDDGEKVRAELSRIFEDADQIAPWAAASVLAAHRAKLIVGKPSANPKSKKLVFDPNGNLTRAEAITLTYRIMKKLKKI
ncbi:S-layer homology domain-containing protein, partial [Thermodesulfitimonas sp.]